MHEPRAGRCRGRAGWWATSNPFPLLAERDDVVLVGVWGLGPDLGAVRDKFGFGMATESVDELLDSGLDAVIVTTPHDLHFDVASKALNRGLHVLCEKPMTLRADQAWDLVERTERADTHLLVRYALCHRASPTRGLFGGDPQHMLERWGSDTKPSESMWSDPAHGGGYAHRQITHSSALFFWLITGASTENNSTVEVAARSVELIEALLKSSTSDGKEIVVHD
ncbi:Gfo/Idh/MocA family oxidoreductase [Mycetocola sp. 2940]|uniref:Gfo/Idh/MocA family protein n=1 Tax=Mycetocola sp. 2940 TaxID=3156452 RepID=UPI003393D8D7